MGVGKPCATVQVWVYQHDQGEGVRRDGAWSLRPTMRNMVASVMELMEARAMASTSESTDSNARSTGVLLRVLSSAIWVSSKCEMMSMSVSLRAFPMKR